VDKPASFSAHYELLLELGRGTTGVVYKARQGILNRLVALKMPLLDSASEASLRAARFRREAEVLARLTWKPDPNLPALFSAPTGLAPVERRLVHQQGGPPLLRPHRACPGGAEASAQEGQAPPFFAPTGLVPVERRLVHQQGGSAPP